MAWSRAGGATAGARGVCLAGALIDAIPDLHSGPQAVNHIRNKWLTGRSMSDVLLSRLEGLQYQRGTSFLAFTSEFNMLASSVEPPIPARRACEMFNARLPAEYDNFCQQAEVDPGFESVNVAGADPARVDPAKSLAPFTDKVVELVHKYEARNAARERLTPSTHSPATRSLHGAVAG